jgi:integrative and conjugative element protein (TIGR02256 family)
VNVPHRRFARLPHVQWEKEICLYQESSTEWLPGDGMFGFLDRLLEWFERAAAGSFEPPGEPLHPPVAYPGRFSGCVVIDADAPRARHGMPELGFATLDQIVPDRADVAGWLDLDAAWPPGATTQASLSERLHSLTGGPTGPNGVRRLLGAVVVLPRAVAFEFPRSANRLVEVLAEQGLKEDEFVSLLGMTALANQLLATRSQSDGMPSGPPTAAPPLYLFVGTPTAGGGDGQHPVTHLAAWRLPGLGARLAMLLADRFRSDPAKVRQGMSWTAATRAWLAACETEWEVVYERRPELVIRRDHGSPSGWLRGRRVMVLGCGALGAPIAEHCVRAGAGSVLLVDRGDVNPGVLVRQPYDELDIGRPKVVALAERLGRIRPNVGIAGGLDAVQVLEAATRDGAVPDVDLVIDATASHAVAARLERLRWPARGRWPPVASFAIGHRAERGVATLCLPGATGSGVDMLRRLGLAGHLGTRDGLGDLVADLFPDPPRTTRFHPEPGCSAPTFVGSAAEVAALAGHLLTAVLGGLSARDGGVNEPMAAHVVRLTAPDGQPTLAPERVAWWNDLLVYDAPSGYEIRIAGEVLDRMRQEAQMTRHVFGPPVETGGLLLGQIDDACQVVWVSLASGPPPGSRRSSDRLWHGTEGVSELIERCESASAGALRFIGLWHTHPYGRVQHSDIDERAMDELLQVAERAPHRALLVILGGSRWSAWLEGSERPELSVQLRTI